MNLTCHLESADSVRSNPTSLHFNRQSNRLFAEAFTHLLFGDQLRFGQIPIFDSYALVRFLAELIEAKKEIERERSADVAFLPDFKPVVMTHYAGLGGDHRFRSSQTVLRETLGNKLSDPVFENSALPNIGRQADLANRISQAIQPNGIRLETFEKSLHDELRKWPDELAHLQRLQVIDDYFQEPGLSQPNRSERMIPLRNAIVEALNRQSIIEGKGYDDIVQFYESLVNKYPKLGRSNVYAEAKTTFEKQPERVAIAKELADSLYMWNEARLAGARTETTSSGVETDDEALRRDGEVISIWADKSKAFLESQSEQKMESRPVLQRCSLHNESALNNEVYRRSLLKELASYIISPAFLEERRNALAFVQFEPDVHKRPAKNLVVDYWSQTREHIRKRTNLLRFIDLAVDIDGVISIRFKQSEFGCHQLGLIAPGLAVDGDPTDQILQTMQSEDESRDLHGANLNLG